MNKASDLQREALAKLPLPQETVENQWNGNKKTAPLWVLELMISHERLRYELQGAEEVIRNIEEKLKESAK